MGRRPTFDTHAVVTAARALFWERGYEGASLPELERVTGLNRSSLYNVFGSKRGLFDAAVHSYLDDVVQPRLAPLLRESVAPEAVVDHVEALKSAILNPESMPARNGCLLVNAAGSTLGHEKVTQAVVNSYREHMAKAMRRGVTARFPAMDDAEVDRLTQTCVGLVVAALVMARVNGAAAVASLDCALELLDA